MRHTMIQAINYKAVLYTLFLLSFFSLTVEAQTPQGLPKPSDNEPIDLSSPFSIIFFIVIPVLAILLYFWLKSRKQNK